MSTGLGVRTIVLLDLVPYAVADILEQNVRPPERTNGARLTQVWRGL